MPRLNIPSRSSNNRLRVVIPTTKTSGPVNPGPYSKHRDFPIGDRMEPEDWRGIFDDYEEGSDKIGYPSVGIRGSVAEGAEAVGALCAFCRVPFVVVAPDRGQCPSCGRPTSIARILEAPNQNDSPRQRKQLAIGDPKSQKLQPNLDLEEGGKEIAQDRPRDGTLPFDITMYPRATGPDFGS